MQYCGVSVRRHINDIVRHLTLTPQNVHRFRVSMLQMITALFLLVPSSVHQDVLVLGRFERVFESSQDSVQASHSGQEHAVVHLEVKQAQEIVEQRFLLKNRMARVISAHVLREILERREQGELVLAMLEPEADLE